MKTRTTGMLLLAVLLLGAFILLVERRGPDTEHRRAAARLAFHIAPDAVRMLRIETTGSVLRCARGPDGWRMEEPVAAPADASAIQRLLYALETMPREALITKAEREQRGQTLASYGFEPARAAIRVEGDGMQLDMEVGRVAPLGGLYVRELGQDAVVATSTNILAALPASPADLRDRTLFRFDPYQVHRIQVRRPEGFLQLARGEGGVWTIQQPFAARADAAVVEDWIERILHLRVEEFVRDRASDFTPYGFDEPASAEISFDVDPADPPTVTLSVGRASDPASGRRYARWKGKDSVLALDAAVTEITGMSVNRLRDRRLAAFDPATIQSVAVTRGEQNLRLERKNGAWTLTEPEEAPADGEAVDQFIREWASMRVEDFIPPPAATNRTSLGLDTPYVRLVFGRDMSASAATNGAATATILVAGMQPHPQGWLAAAFGDERPVWIRPPAPSLMSPQPLLYRSHDVLALATNEVQSLAWSHDGREQTVERDATGAWGIKAGAQGVLDLGRIQARVMELSRLRARSLVADRPASLQEYGLDVPAATLTLSWGKEEKSSKTLLLGRSTPEGTFATIRGQSLVFLLDNDLSQRLQEELYAAPASSDPVPAPAAP